MPKHSQLRTAIHVALALGCAVVGTTAWAQATEGQNPSDKAVKLEAVEVTGSRIKRVDVETSQPVFTLSHDDIQAQGLTSIGDVIQNLTSTGAALNSSVNSGGSGQSRVSLRNLGSNRTLVLVNGHRWVGGTGLNSEVDLNSIPTAAVERVEVLKDGASVIYGSDAIAGVINVILREKLNGVEANAYYGQYDKGDGAHRSYDFTAGTVKDNFSVMMGVSHVSEDPVMAGDRAISAVPVYGATPGYRAVADTPNGRFSFSPSGTSPFTNDGPGTAYRPFKAPQDNYNTATDRYLTVDQNIDSIFANAQWDITSNVRFKLYSQYMQRTTGQLLPANPVNFGGNARGKYAEDIGISADSMYNPFGRDVTWGGRMIDESGGRLIERHVHTLAVGAGFDGAFNVGERLWTWEAGYFFGRNENDDFATGQQDLSKVGLALGPSMVDPGSGRPICVSRAGDPRSAIAGCVPLNLMGGSGSITPEMLGYTDFLEHSKLGYEQKSYYANLTGDLFDLPAGPFAFAAGFEHRAESGYDKPDALISSGVTNGFTRQPTSGGFDVDEAYLELSIPVLADLPGARLLDISAATRYSDYSNFGDTTNSKFGFRWKPVDSLLVRGNYSEGFRAPSIRELYLGQSSNNLQNVTDPCAATLQGSPLPDSIPCAGVPTGLDQSSSAISVTAGGNPQLGPETSKSRTFGFVYSPTWATGLDLSVDWWRVDIDNAISTFSSQTVLDLCYRGSVQHACDLIDRASDGQIVSVLSVPTNVGSLKAEGYDMTLSYRLPEFSWGQLGLVWDTTYLTRHEEDQDGDGYISQDPVTGDGGNQVGGGSNWRIRSNLSLQWQRKSFGVNWNMRYFSPLTESCTGLGAEAKVVCSDPYQVTDLSEPRTPPEAPAPNGPDSRPINRIPSVIYHDISVYWKAPWNARFTLGVNNAFDRDPPVAVTLTNSFNPAYDLPGRFVYMKYSQKF
jgi:iron complex outermembrane receptor protein